MSVAEMYMCYVTCPDQKTAENIAYDAISHHHAACANIIPGMTSIYYWSGQLETSKEVVLILKTMADKIEELKGLVVQAHPYSCPCFIAWPVSNGHPPYMEWIRENTQRS